MERSSFDPVSDVAALMRGFRGSWAIAGGWALDLFLGRVSSTHEDVDVAILRRDQAEIRAHLSDWEFVKIAWGRWGPWLVGERLELPVHEVLAHRTGGAPADLEFLLNEAAGERWIFRRDSRITSPLSKVEMRTASGIPFFVPEIVLLYKAKRPGTKDEVDFDAATPMLEPQRRAWLRDALDTCHPGHPWIRQL